MNSNGQAVLDHQMGVNTMSLKKIVFHLTLASVGAGICNIALAADENRDKSATLEEVVVTGSRVKGSELNSASPVTIVTAEAIFESGISNV